MYFLQQSTDELITILEKRCRIPPSYCEKMVAVMKELQKRRQTGSSSSTNNRKSHTTTTTTTTAATATATNSSGSIGGGERIFDGKKSLITPRDLFRWAQRTPTSYQELAEVVHMHLFHLSYSIYCIYFIYLVHYTLSTFYIL